MFSRYKFIFILFSLVFSACSSSLVLQPTPTPTPTLTPTVTLTPSPTHTLTPTITSTPDLLAYYLPSLPSKPDGFEWKIIPNVNMAVLIPDGWFFKEENRIDLGLEGFYVTKENIDTEKRFSTGLTVYVYRDFATHAEAEKYATDLMGFHANLETTKQIINAWDYPVNQSTFHHLRIESEFPNEVEINKNKIIHYTTLAYGTKVFMATFESPYALWDETFTNIGNIVMDRIAILK